MKTNDLDQWTIASLETQTGKVHVTDNKLYLITNNTVTNYISLAPLKAINHKRNYGLEYPVYIWQCYETQVVRL